MPLCQKTHEITPEIVFRETRLRISLISHTMHFNLSQTDAVRKHFVSTLSVEKLSAFCGSQFHLAMLGTGSLFLIGSNVKSSN